jgi:hypothetical protein
MKSLPRVPGPKWFRLLAHLLIFAALMYAIMQVMQEWLSWHFEHPIEPK